MLVKKVDSEWRPDKQPDIKVGETIDITNPKMLILEGKVVAVTKEGATISAYELYGVITRSERKEFEEYLKFKKQQDLEKQLEKDNEKLKAEAKVQEVMKPTAIVEDKIQEVIKPVEQKEVKKTTPKSLKLAEL